LGENSLSTHRPNILYFLLLLAFFPLFILFVAGCGPKPRLLPQERTSDGVLSCAIQNQIEFDTFAALLNLKIKGEEGKFSGTIEFFYQQPNSFSFYPRTLFGIGSFRAAGEGDSLTIYYPKQKEFYSGSFSELEETELWSWEIPLDLLVDMILTGRESVDPNVHFIQVRKDVFQYGFEDENWIREYWIESQRCRLTESRWVQKGNGESYQVEYKNFATRGKVDLPRIITIKSQSGDLVRIKFLERRFNPSLSQRKFQLEIPPDAKRVVFERKK
jgi:outer membrane lipoprotein-sorting protein